MSIEHGIRAVPPEGTRFKSTTYALKADNYTAWSCRMKAVFIVNNVWDIVDGSRTRPPPPPVLRLAISSAGGNEDLVKEANKQIAEFQGAANRAVCFLAESISDSILLSVTNILADPAATRRKLHQKFARKSELEHEAAQKAFLSFSIKKLNLQRRQSRGSRLSSTELFSKMSLCLLTKSSELCYRSRTTDMQHSRATTNTLRSSQTSISSANLCVTRISSTRRSTTLLHTELQPLQMLSKSRQHTKQKYYGPNERRQNLQNHRAANRRLLTPHATAMEIEVTMPETADKQAPNANFVTRQVTLRKCARRRSATIQREKLLSSMVADRHQWIFRAVILITAREKTTTTQPRRSHDW